MARTMRKRLRNRRAGKRRNYRGPVKGLGRLPAGFLSVAKTYYLGAMTPTINSSQGTGKAAFAISLEPDLATLAPNFELYRICAAQIRVIPQSNDALVGGSSSLGTIYTYFDYTDADPPTGVTEMLQRPDVKIRRADKIFTEYIKGPRTASPVYNGSVLSGYELNKPNQWMSTSNTGIPHYGWKWFVDTFANQTAQVYIKLYVQYKGPK